MSLTPGLRLGACGIVAALATRTSAPATAYRVKQDDSEPQSPVWTMGLDR
jgi:hypothetical protein